jgi:YVTN family beta-propeller protein
MAIYKEAARREWLLALAFVCGACGSDAHDEPTEPNEPGDTPEVAAPVKPTEKQLENRAYIVSQRSDELTVIDLDKFEIIGRVPTGGFGNHMAELTGDFRQILVTSAETDEGVIVDTVNLKVDSRFDLVGHPTHIARTPDDRLFAVMTEETNEVAFVDGNDRSITKRLGGFSTPHFMRFTSDGNFGYVANIGGNRITRVDMQNLEIMGDISLDGFADRREIEEEGGFADAQIASDGVLYAAHHSSGKVLAIDSNTGKKLTEISVGSAPWVAFAEHPFKGVKLNHVVPNFGDKTVSIINGLNKQKPEVSATLEGDEEAYGVNFSPLAPDLAFVMNRVREDIAVVDTTQGKIIERIPVGGNTETASTTPDGKYIVATVSSANQVVIIDVVTRKVKKTFDNIGSYPWSVTIPKGQNYCH